MKNMLKLLILICASVLQAEIIPETNLDSLILDQILRNTRSDITTNEINAWPDQPELPEFPNYRNTDRNQYRRHNLHHKTMAPVNLFRTRTNKFKERMDKRQRNAVGNSNVQKLVVCHFKLCNMVGKNMLFKKSYDWRESPLEQ